MAAETPTICLGEMSMNSTSLAVTMLQVAIETCEHLWVADATLVVKGRLS